MKESGNDLQRFHEAQDGIFERAYQELEQGRKQSHWMWFIFPQIKGLGFSAMSQRYAIRDLQEAEQYLEDRLLADRLISLCLLLLNQEGRTAYEIFGSPDDFKLRSSMTLFASVRKPHPVFQQVLDKYFAGKKDPKTLAIIGKQ